MSLVRNERESLDRSANSGDLHKPRPIRKVIVEMVLFLFVLLSLTGTAHPQQTYQTGKIIKWDTEPYSQSAHIVRNGVVYYIQVGTTIYQVTRHTTKPDTNLVAGHQLKCRVDKDSMFIPDDRGKEVKYRILGASSAE
jgi:hypothetical protein